MSSATDNFISKLFKLNNRNNTLIYTVEADRPIVIIGGSLSILSDDSEQIDFSVAVNSVTYTLLRNYKIDNDFPSQFIESIKRLVLNPGDSIYIQAKNSYGVTASPDIHGQLSFVRQPKLV